VITTGKEGYLVYGPNVTLPPGDYIIQYIYDILEDNGYSDVVRFDVTSDRGKTPLTEFEFCPGDRDTGEHQEILKFHLNKTQEYVEWRVHVTENAKIMLKEIAAVKKE
jgi:hypothetical protein